MTSIFRRALTSSVSRDEPGNSIANPESPKTLSVKASPSFNDFSLCAHDDGASRDPMRFVCCRTAQDRLGLTGTHDGASDEVRRSPFLRT
jgi:hypothetical protein